MPVVMRLACVEVRCPVPPARNSRDCLCQRQRQCMDLTYCGAIVVSSMYHQSITKTGGTSEELGGGAVAVDFEQYSLLKKYSCV